MESEEGRVIIESKGEESYSEEAEPYYPSEVLKIPKGHMPPPGKCRIWYPDLPPGHQPPVGECEDLQYHNVFAKDLDIRICTYIAILKVNI